MYALRFVRNIFDWVIIINDENVKKKYRKIKEDQVYKLFCHTVVESKLISMNYKGQPNSERTIIQYANSFLIF